MSLGKLETLPEYKKVCEHIIPVYTDIIFSYLTEIRKDYYDSGEIKCETPYINNKAHGIEKWYYKSGQIESEIPFINDKRTGIEKEYYKSGQIKYELSIIDQIK
jgi:antitoxin component YwqK of YwqJK toxin-antitoxin module